MADKDDPAGRRRLFLPIKNNLGNDHDGLAFHLDDSRQRKSAGRGLGRWACSPGRG